MLVRRPVESKRMVEYDVLTDVLREARIEAGISQERLSALLDQAPTYIYNCEKGSRRVDVVEFRLIAKSLGIDPLALYKRYEDAVLERVDKPSTQESV